MHINNEYVKQGKINPEELFEIEEISEEVDKLLPFVEENSNNMIKVIQGKRPNKDIGPQCKSPYVCPLTDKCWKFLPKNNVFDLVGIGTKGFELLNEGIPEIKNIPSGYKLTEKQSIQKDCIVNDAKHVDIAAIKSFLGTLKYPIHYFDFETINPAIPLYDGMKPYQQVPFQFSLHIQQKDGKVEHFEYLHDGKEDPRPNLLKEMKKSFQDKGSIIVYYQSFEKGRLKELSESFPEYKAWVDSLLIRFVDLYNPFSKFFYYNPKQKRSVSLKATMLSLTGVGYNDLEISNGGMTMRAYSYITFGKIGKEEKIKIRKNMLKYCGQDTEGMIWMVDALKKIV